MRRKTARSHRKSSRRRGKQPEPHWSAPWSAIAIAVVAALVSLFIYRRLMSALGLVILPAVMIARAADIDQQTLRSTLRTTGAIGAGYGLAYSLGGLILFYFLGWRDIASQLDGGPLEPVTVSSVAVVVTVLILIALGYVAVALLVGALTLAGRRAITRSGR